MNQKIWFTRLDEFNDPFEGRFIFKPLRPKEILSSNDVFKSYCDGLNIQPKDLEAALSHPNAEKILRQSSIVTDFFKAHGALCLTEDASNIPMWAHYADNHQGYCVVFEIDLDQIYEKSKEQYEKQDPKEYTRPEFDEYVRKIFYPASQEYEILSFQQGHDPDKQVILSKVNYQEELPIIEHRKILSEYSKNGGQYLVNKYLTLNSVSVKDKQWEYEQEYRLIVNANSKEAGLMDLRGYPFIKVTGVIMGQNIGKSLNKDLIDFMESYELHGNHLKGNTLDKKIKHLIVRLGQQNNMEIYLAKCLKDSYKIRHKRICIK